MHPTNVATAAWVFASAPSKVPFYIAGGLLAAWAVLVGFFGITHPDFPGTVGRSRLVMLTSALLVVATATTAVTTAGEEGASETEAAGTSALNLSADASGRLAFDKKQATVSAGRLGIELVNKSSTPHNITIAKGTRVLAHTKTVTGGTATATANLAPGEYVFYCSVDAHRAGGMQGTLTVR